MRREKVFSKGGLYHFTVQSNALLHREATEHGIAILREVLANYANDRIISVLDLACGGAPIAIADIIESFTDRKFEYLGIDINPDQVHQASTEFPFPSNIQHIEIEEGNAWDLRRIKRKFDVVFTGLNLHHGTPEEIYCLLRQIGELLTENGVFINHDMYRPCEEQYIRRPNVNPNDSSESYLLMSHDLLASYETPKFDFAFVDFNQYDADWRKVFLPQFKSVLLGRGADADGVDVTLKHVYSRDFCLSTAEVKTVIEQAGYKVTVHSYEDSPEPLRKYYAMVVAVPKR